MTSKQQRQVRVVYSNNRPDSIFSPYRTLEEAEDMASKAETYAHVVDVLIETYYAPESPLQCNTGE